ncbi:aromatic ring-hydroxylating oxygenase subunit alpha [Mesorhizobium sp. URHB0026]
MQPNASEREPYNGLTRTEPTLPSSAYWDQDNYKRDLDAIWYRDWLLVCREADLAQPLAFRTFRVGTQEILVLRDDTGELRAFHNTCRHRGSQLCQESEGRLKARLITCPYHAWSYSLRGDLVRVPSKSLPDGFDKADHPLYRVALSGVAGLRLRQSCGRCRRLGAILLRPSLRRSRQLAAGNAGIGPCAAQGDEL